jgi:hypothetical protein
MRFRFDFFFLEALGAVELPSMVFSAASSSLSDSTWAVGWDSEAFSAAFPLPVATGSPGLDSSAIFRVREGEGAVNNAGVEVDVGLVGCDGADFIGEICVPTKVAGDHVRCSL